MAGRLSATLDLTLDVRQAAGNCATPTAPVSPGVGYSARLSLDADLEVGSTLGATDPGPDPLPLPSNLEGRALYFRVLSGGPFDVDVTHAIQGATTYPVAAGGVLVLIPADDEYITAVSVTGSGTYEWSVAGSEA